MTQPIDTAYVDIVARGEDDAAREIARALNKIAAEVKKLTESIEKEFSQAGREMESEVQQATKSIERDLERQSRAAKKTGTSLALAMKEASASAAHSIDDMADQATRDLSRIEHAAERAAVAVSLAGKTPEGGGEGGGGSGGINLPGRTPYIGRHRDVDIMSGALSGLANIAGTATRAISELAENLGNRLANAGRQAAQTLGVLTGSVMSALGPIGSIISGMGMLGAAMLLTPLIVPLIGALSQLTGLFALLPGTISILVAAIAPLMIAFSGIGAAVTALASGDLEQIDKAMQNLAPNARKFAVELFKVKDQLKAIKTVVQTEFFKEFNGSLTTLVSNTLPMLKSGLGGVAGALGRMLAGITDLLGSHDIVEAIGDVFESTERIIDRLSPKFTDMLGTIIGAIEHSLPFVERFFGKIGDGMETFTNWLSEAMKSGDFEKWLENAFDVAGKLWDLLKSVGRLLGAVFGDTADDGKDLLETLTDIVDKWTEWFESPEGQKARDDAIQTMKDLMGAIKTLSGWLVTLGQWGTRIKDFFGGIPGAISDAAAAVGGFFTDLWGHIKGAGAAVGEWFGSVGRWFSEAGQTVSEKGGEILQWFQDLPGNVGAWLAGLPGVISTAFQTASDQILYWIGYAFGWVLSETIALPGRIAESLTTLWNTFTEWFTRTRDDVVRLVTETWDNVTEWFDKLPGRVGTALSNMWNSVTDWFGRTRRSATDAASGTVDSVVGWFQKLPGRATSAIQKLPGQIWNILRGIVTDADNIGRDIMYGIGDGIRNGWNSAINAARDAARQVLRGFWDAFDINSPSKLMMREVGAPIMEGVGLGIKHETPKVTRTIDETVNRTVKSVSANVGQDAAVATGASVSGSSGGSGGGGIMIQSLTIPIQGVWDMSDPTAARRIAYDIHEALESLKRDYR